MKILAIESSCDETSAAVVENGSTVKSNVISTSRHAFEQTGGVIPEDAARRQVECILPVVNAAMSGAKMTWKDIDAIAVTKGPGLLGSLLVGTVAARAIAHIQQKPLIGVHHTLGHLSSTWLDTDGDTPQFPILTLSASGGHTDLWLRASHTKGTLIGRTRDDAAGEAFDKGAFLLGLPYPGGPSIAKAATEGNVNAFEFPRPLHDDPSVDFSFSGLKTALRYVIRDLGEDESKKRTADLAASYERALCMHLCDRMKHAIDQHPEIREIHLVGGVSANTVLRSMATSIDTTRPVRFPKTLAYCTDNAAMIGAAAQFLFDEHGDSSFEGFTTEASLPLSDAITRS